MSKVMQTNSSIPPQYYVKYTNDALLSFFWTKHRDEKRFIIQIPIEQASFFKKNILPIFDTFFSKGKDVKGFKILNLNNLDYFLKSTQNYSPKFLKELHKQLSTLSLSKTELFLEYNAFNYIFAKKANPLFDILRIKNNILTKKIAHSEYKVMCVDTYYGFLRALSEKTLKLVSLKIDGKQKDLLVKTHAGVSKDSNSKRIGINFLALDPESFDIYSLFRSNTKSNFEYLRIGSEHNKTDKFLKNYLTNFKKTQKFKEFKTKLKALSLKNEKNISSFKRDVKKMLEDPKKRALIKGRFRKGKFKKA